MPRWGWSCVWVALCGLAALAPAGCQNQTSALARLPDTMAQFIAYEPLIGTDDPGNVPEYESIVATQEPRRVLNQGKMEYWDATLEEILRIALANIAVIRDRAQFLSPSNLLLANPDATPSGFDPAIQESGGPNSYRGVETAQADFDPVLTLSTIWSDNALIQNNTFLSGGLQAGSELDENNAAFIAQASKTLTTGGQLTLSQTWDYNQNNAPNRLYTSVYVGALTAAYRQPLWAGSGVDFTSIAGPLSRNIPGGPLNQGLEIARLNTRISTIDFENRTMTLLKNVTDAWWDLAFAYEAYESEVQARDAAKQIWDQIKSRVDNGLERASVADEAQSRANYLERCVQTSDALTVLYQREAQLRRLIGLNVNDGFLIRPADGLRAQEATPDWQQTLAEALTHRIELRRQKTVIENVTIQLRAARSLANPQVDFISSYNINGFGDNLFNINNRGPYPGAYGTLFAGNQTGWNLGFQASMPLGFRAAKTQIRNLELRLAKARSVLAAQELEISHELANAYQQSDRWLANIELQEAKQEAARERAAAVAADYRTGRTSIDLLVRAEAALTEATVAYQKSQAEYRKALTELNYRAGRLLETLNITLADGISDARAYRATLARNLERVRGATPQALQIARENTAENTAEDTADGTIEQVSATQPASAGKKSPSRPFGPAAPEYSPFQLPPDDSTSADQPAATHPTTDADTEATSPD
ncbi:MAG: TolC family protein [Planctomycetes bacterium]|nr:TolC family protein [Planctomycetota bacterium]